jgi:hypothetical protein
LGYTYPVGGAFGFPPPRRRPIASVEVLARRIKLGNDKVSSCYSPHVAGGTKRGRSVLSAFSGLKKQGRIPPTSVALVLSFRPRSP